MERRDGTEGRSFSFQNEVWNGGTVERRDGPFRSIGRGRILGRTIESAFRKWERRDGPFRSRILGRASGMEQRDDLLRSRILGRSLRNHILGSVFINLMMNLMM